MRSVPVKPWVVLFWWLLASVLLGVGLALVLLTPTAEPCKRCEPAPPTEPKEPKEPDAVVESRA